MKKIIKILIILVIIIIICILSLSYTINSNNNYEESITNKISKHYKTNKITYSNYYNNYYIFKTEEDIVVLDNKYKEVYKEKISNLKPNNKYEILYKNNRLIYEEKIIKNNKVTYIYYDAKTNEKIKETVMEK